MKLSTCLFAFCLILSALVLTEASYNLPTIVKPYSTATTRQTRRARRTKTAAPYTTTTTTKRTTTTTYKQPVTQTTTRVYTTRRTTTTYRQPVTQTTTRVYTTRQTTTTYRQPVTQTTTRVYTTQRTTTTYRQPVTQTTTRVYTTKRTTTAYPQPVTHTTTRVYTTRRQSTVPHYTTRHQSTAYTTTSHSAYTTPSTSTYTTPTTATTSGPDMSEVDIAILNFALNLEYLEAEFYCAAVGRTPSYDNEVGGTVTGGEAVNFTTAEFRQYAEEIASDEEKHVVFLRRVLGDRAVDRPDINIAGGVNGSFGQAARAAAANAGLNQATQDALGTFSPYTNELYFLHGAFIFEDVGVTAYKGAAPALTNKDYVSAAAGLLAVEAYHASEVRTLLHGFRRTIAFAANAVNGSSALRVQDIIGAISGLRAALDGSANGGNDQSIVIEDTDNSGSGSGSGDDDDTNANIVPADDDALAYGRTARQVLNIVYGAQGATLGLFYPNGVNGDFSALL